MRKTRNKTSSNLSRLSLLFLTVVLVPLFVAGCSNQQDSSEASSHISRAETYADQGQYRSALLEVRNAIQVDPNNVNHIVNLAELYQRIGASRPLSELLEPWLEEYPQEVALLLARSYVDQKKPLSAIETLEAFTANSPESRLEKALIQAEARRLTGNTAEALASFQELTESNTSSVGAIEGIAKSYLDLNQPAQAVNALNAWISNHGEDPAALYWKGRALYLQNKLEESSKTLTSAAGMLPSADVLLPLRRDILTSLSQVLTAQGRITEAQVYNKILAEDLNTGDQEQSIAAIAAIKEGDIDQAKAILRDMLKLSPDNEQAAMVLGALSVGTGELEEGKRLLIENLDPETTPTQFIRAATMAQIDAGERRQALQNLERAIKARPNDNELLAMHGIVALSLPAHEEAGVASLSKALTNEPDQVRLRLALAQHHLRKEKPEQALGQLRMAFTSNPSDWATTGAYLNLLLQQGKTSEAEEIRDSLLNGYGNKPQAVMLASIADAQLGNAENALERIGTLVQENPQLQAPKITLAMLLSRTGQTDRAVTTLIEAAKLTPAFIRPLQQAANLYAQDHSINEVKKWLGEVGRENPNLQQNTNVLAALVNIREGDLPAARALLQEWASAESPFVKRVTGELLYAEARRAIQAGEFQTARSKAAEAISTVPDNLEFALLPVTISNAEGKFGEAIAGLEALEETFGIRRELILARTELIREHEGVRPAHEYLHEQWQKTADPSLIPTLLQLRHSIAPESVGELTEKWLDVQPNNAAAHMARAHWLMANNQEIAAATHYEQVLDRQSENVAALNNLAWILRNQDTGRALELSGRARDLAPENAAVLDTYGWILHLSGRHNEARDTLERALALAPENADIKTHLETVKGAM